MKHADNEVYNFFINELNDIQSKYGYTLLDISKKLSISYQSLINQKTKKIFGMKFRRQMFKVFNVEYSNKSKENNNELNNIIAEQAKKIIHLEHEILKLKEQNIAAEPVIKYKTTKK